MQMGLSATHKPPIIFANFIIKEASTNYKIGHISSINQKEFPRNFIIETIKDDKQKLIDEIIKYSKFGDIVSISFHKGKC